MKKQRTIIIFEGNDATGKSHLCESYFNECDDKHTMSFQTPYLVRGVIKNNNELTHLSRQLLSSASHFDLLRKYDVFHDCDIIQDRTFISSMVYFLTAKYNHIDEIKIAFMNDTEFIILKSMYDSLITSLFERFDEIIIKHIKKSTPVGRFFDETDKDVFSSDIARWNLRNETYDYILECYSNDFTIEVVFNEFE